MVTFCTSFSTLHLCRPVYAAETDRYKIRKIRKVCGSRCLSIARRRAVARVHKKNARFTGETAQRKRSFSSGCLVVAYGVARRVVPAAALRASPRASSGGSGRTPRAVR